MNRLFQPTRINTPELIDLPGVTPELLAENLADLQRINRWLGGAWLTLRALDELTADLRRGDELAVVDLATGFADIPQAVEQWAIRRGARLRLVATDISHQIVEIAAQRVPNLAFAVADACQLPCPDRSFDVVMCSLALHHLEPDAAVTMLREMRRVARRGVIVNDIVRWMPGYWGAWLIGRLISRNPLTRHDGPLSVMRAYTPTEMATMASQAGWREVRFKRFLGYRVVMMSRG